VSSLGSAAAASRAIGYAGLGLVGFLVAALCVHLAADRHPLIPSYSDKLDFYKERSDRFSILFLGSSRMRGHVDPRALDPILSRSGRSHRSFNLGIESLNLIELATLVDEVVRLRPPALRYVFIEPVFSTNLPIQNLATERSVYFHDLRNTLLEIRCNLTLPSMRFSVGRNALACAYHYANLGRFSQFRPVESAGSGETFSKDELRQRRGFRAQNTIQTAGLLEWHESFMENLDEYALTMKEGRTLPEGAEIKIACQYDAVRDMARRLREAGFETVFLNTPGFLWIQESLLFEEYHRQVRDPTPLISYLRGHDEIYEPSYWYDPRHLTGEGARLFSERLGRDLLDVLSDASGF
jgi:hypothetical protein